MKYHFKVYRESGGFWAECMELKGCHTQGDSEAELAHNMREALNAYLEEPPESNWVFPLPKRRLQGRGIVAVEVGLSVAFAVCLRRLRHKHGITQKQAAQKLGFKSLFSYQRLENPETANPELETIARIKRVFPEFRVDEILAA